MIFNLDSFIPPVVDVYEKTSPLSIGLPPTSYYLEVFPLVIIGYLLLFGDFVTGIEIIKDGQKNRPDELSILILTEHIIVLVLEIYLAQ